jgi:hypothetical protein
VSTEETAAARLPSKMIGKKRQRVIKLRDVYHQQAINDVSDELVKELASVCLEYSSLLREFRDEPAVDRDDFPDVTPIRNRLGKKTRIKTESKRRGGGITYKEAPAVLELDPQYLVEVTHALDDLSQKLGFGAAAAQQVDVFGVDTDPTGDR